MSATSAASGLCVVHSSTPGGRSRNSMLLRGSGNAAWAACCSQPCDACEARTTRQAQRA